MADNLDAQGLSDGLRITITKPFDGGSLVPGGGFDRYNLDGTVNGPSILSTDIGLDLFNVRVPGPGVDTGLAAVLRALWETLKQVLDEILDHLKSHWLFWLLIGLGVVLIVGRRR
jgi:hypothetical protein